LASAPDLWDDQANAQRVTGKLSVLQADIGRIKNLRSRVDDVQVLWEMGEAESDQGILDEAGAELIALEKSIGELEVRTLLSGEYDHREALISIRSGAGGVDAADWAEMLQRMYLRYCERHGWATDVYETSYAEEAGIKSTTFAVKAPFAYGTLSVEQGTHRLVRISPFDNQSRRQTSFAEVEVIPVVEQTDSVEIPDDDLRVDVYRSSGPGGQGVNTTDSAVRLTHIPTGIVVSCAPSYKTRQLQWRCCKQEFWNALAKKNRPRLMHSRETRVAPGEIKCAPTCCILTKWLKTLELKLKQEILPQCSMEILTSLLKPEFAGAANNQISDTPLITQ
jgi:peptide chain release factor 2